MSIVFIEICYKLCYTNQGDKMKKIKLILCLILSSALIGCQNNSVEKADGYTNAAGCKVSDASMTYYTRYADTYPSMEYFDTSLSLAVYTNKQSNFLDAYNLMVERFKYYHELFDKYNNYDNVNNVKTINDNAGVAPVVVADELMELLLLSKEWYEKSLGAFDITLGPVLEIWHDYREEGTQLPTLEELAAANEYVGWEFIELDEANNTVYINNPNASIDVGGVAKGFAVEKVAQDLECSGVSAGFINAGGNVRMIGTKPDSSPWHTGINHPAKEYSNQYYGTTIISIRMKGMESAVTSGDYQRYYVVDGKEYSHLISPFTLFPPDLYNSVTVKYDNSGIADILSTTIYMLPYEDGLKVLNSVDALGIWISKNEEALSGANPQFKNDYYIGTNGKLDLNSSLITWED